MDYQEEFEQTPIVKIKLSDTEPYSKHPFKVEDNKKIEIKFDTALRTWYYVMVVRNLCFLCVHFAR